jgi:hypothetical protein
MRNEATHDSAQTVIQLIIHPVIHPQNVISPDETDSSRGGGTGREGPDGGSLTGALCTGFTLMPIPAANATGTR